MMNIAIDNLKLLNSEETIFKDNYLISEGNKLSFISKNNYDLVLNNKSLEYPIYFTYNHILNFISDDSEISYQKKKYLLNIIDKSLNNIYQFIPIKIKNEDDEKFIGSGNALFISS